MWLYFQIDLFLSTMGHNTSQAPAELSEEDIEFISSKAKIDHDSVITWYDKLKVRSRHPLLSHRFPYFVSLSLSVQAACPNGKISKAETVSFLRSINSGKDEQILKQAADIHKAFDANNDGIVGTFAGRGEERVQAIFVHLSRSTRISHRLCSDVDGQFGGEAQIRLSHIRSRQGWRDQQEGDRSHGQGNRWKTQSTSTDPIA